MDVDMIIGIFAIAFLLLGIAISFEMGIHAREQDHLMEQLKEEKAKNQRLIAEAKVFRERYLAAVTGRKIDKDK